jgi:hypothetical protein
MLVRGRIELRKLELQAHELRRYRKAHKQGHKKMMKGRVAPSIMPTMV